MTKVGGCLGEGGGAGFSGRAVSFYCHFYAMDGMILFRLAWENCASPPLGVSVFFWCRSDSCCRFVHVAPFDRQRGELGG